MNGGVSLISCGWNQVPEYYHEKSSSLDSLLCVAPSRLSPHEALTTARLTASQLQVWKREYLFHHRCREHPRVSFDGFS